jgi:hypothetical protein
MMPHRHGRRRGGGGGNLPGCARAGRTHRTRQPARSGGERIA